MFNKQFFNLLGFILTDIFEIVPSLLFIDLFRHTYMSPIHHMKIVLNEPQAVHGCKSSFKDCFQQFDCKLKVQDLVNTIKIRFLKVSFISKLEFNFQSNGFL